MNDDARDPRFASRSQAASAVACCVSIHCSPGDVGEVQRVHGYPLDLGRPMLRSLLAVGRRHTDQRTAARRREAGTVVATPRQVAKVRAHGRVRMVETRTTPVRTVDEPRRRTMPRRDAGPSVKDKKLYEELRGEGNSKEKSARIANAAAGSSRSAVGRKGGSSPSYDDWTVADLRKRAAEIGIEGRSSMKKADLVEALRSH